MVNLTVYQYVNFTIFIVFLFFAILQLNQKNKSALNYYLACVFFFTGYNFYYYWMLSMGLLKNIPLLINSEICFGFLIGPLIFFYFGTLSGAERYKPQYLIPHLIPFIVSSVLITVLNITDSESFLNYVSSSVLPDYSHNQYIMIINTLCDTSMAVYLVLNLITISIFLRAMKFDFEILAIFIFFFYHY
jgi:hypothetical protein